MTNRVIAASEWVTFNPLQQQGLSLFGALPTNDVFLPLWQLMPKIWVLKGGRGGGKSEAIADRLIEKCRTASYFKCYYGRKVFETVRGSCFETIIACIEKRNLKHEFRYSVTATSSMLITHKVTGNTFVPFGSDKADKLKSIKDPTDIWCEEFPEFTFDDFKELYPTLRTIKAENQLWLSFNAYSVHTDHWIVKLFDPGAYTGSDEVEDLLKGTSVRLLTANYYDNHFIDTENYRHQLWLAAGGNQRLFDGLANGEYGYLENTNPWLYSWDEDRLVKPDLPKIPGFPVIISFDFNNDPFAATAWQYSPRMGIEGQSFIHCIREFTGKIKIEDMCRQIRAAYPNDILYVTGDRSGQNEDLGRNQTLYQMIADLLGTGKRALVLNTKNLEHQDSRVFINAMMAHYPNFYISRKGCPQLIKQCGIATTDGEKTNKPSQLLKDRGMYKLDEFDSMRYFLQTYFHDFAKTKYLRLKAVQTPTSQHVRQQPQVHRSIPLR